MPVHFMRTVSWEPLQFRVICHQKDWGQFDTTRDLMKITCEDCLQILRDMEAHFGNRASDALLAPKKGTNESE